MTDTALPLSLMVAADTYREQNRSLSDADYDDRLLEKLDEWTSFIAEDDRDFCARLDDRQAADYATAYHLFIEALRSLQGAAPYGREKSEKHFAATQTCWGCIQEYRRRHLAR